MQLMIILILCKVLGVLLSYVRQVQVIGEILAGILVGPTVLGQWSVWRQYIFPSVTVSAASNNYITLAADVGIVLFMFCVGLDLNESLVRKQWKRAMPVAAAAIAFPFCLGLGLGAWLFDENNRLLDVPVQRTAFYLFLGSSMSLHPHTCTRFMRAHASCSIAERFHVAAPVWCTGASQRYPCWRLC